MKERRKKKQRVRERDWAAKGDTAFTHDLKRHRRTNTAILVETPRREVPSNFEPNGLVVRHTKKYAFVRHEGNEILCQVSADLIEGHATILAPGDAVLVEHVEGQPWVIAVKPRKTKLSRLAIEQSRVTEQIIAANVDVLVIVVSAAQPAPKIGLIDRYLIVAQVGGVEPVICLNKLDLVDAAPEAMRHYRELSIPVIEASCETGQGIEELAAMISNRTSVFAGQSGVGKSSLLNRIAPSLAIETQTVSHSNEKGRHTTTSAQLYELPGGIRVIDTPGIRQLGLWEVTHEQLDYYFPEVAALSARCKFRDCSHTHEPVCAVRDAASRGDIPERRYLSYLRIREELKERVR